MLVASGGIGRGMFVIPGERRLGVENRPWLAAAVPMPRWVGKTSAYYGRPVRTNWRANSSSNFELDPATTDHIAPGWSPERVEWRDDLDCQSVAPGQISPAGWTIAGASIRTLAWGMLSIESVVGGLLVDVLDEDGDIIETIDIDGEDPCITAIVHPEAGVGPLRWEFHLTARDISGGEVDPIPGIQPRVLGRTLIDDWPDARYGARRTYRTTPQILVGSYASAQVFATLIGPTDRYRVRVTTGLEGYLQAGGPTGAARNNAERRN